MAEPTDKQIYDEIETHCDNGVPPTYVAQFVAEVLEVPLPKVKKVWRKWMKDAGWVL